MSDAADSYDERTSELDVAGAELGWDGATTQAERDAAAISDERLDWIERWARGHKSALGGFDYATLPLQVAVDMILELTEALRA